MYCNKQFGSDVRELENVPIFFVVETRGCIQYTLLGKI